MPSISSALAVGERRATMTLPRGMTIAGKSYGRNRSQAHRTIANPGASLAEVVDGPRARLARLAAMSYVLERLINYGKLHGPWTDRTGNLRARYFGTIKENGPSVEAEFGNSADYASYVEWKPGYWVISGAIRAELPNIGTVMAAVLREAGPGGAGMVGTAVPGGPVPAQTSYNRAAGRRRAGYQGQRRRR